MAKSKKISKLSRLSSQKVILAVFVLGFAGFGAYKLAFSSASTCVDYLYGYGGSGTCVKHIQTLANHKLPYIPPNTTLVVDGSFGLKTREGIYRIQEKWGLQRDGKVGPQTWKTLCSTGTVSSAKGGPFSAAELAAYRGAGCSKFYGPK